MKLHVEYKGSGPDLVLLHGWGFHSGAWQSQAGYLAARFRLTLVDLPGHGRSEPLPRGDCLEAVADAVADAAPAGAFWLGWSLGALVALQVAISRPEQVKKLVLVAGTPRFVTAPDWPDAIAPAALTELLNGLKANPPAALKRFVLLQLRGSARAKAVAQVLMNQLSSPPGAEGERLVPGLILLRDSDLRAQVPAVRCPALFLLGGRDPLVPARIGGWMLSHLRQGQRYVISQAGHAPFLSHPGLFQQALECFLRSDPGNGR